MRGGGCECEDRRRGREVREIKMCAGNGRRVRGEGERGGECEERKVLGKEGVSVNTC